MIKNRKGFTLVEVLAVLVVLGIILGISLPLIRRLQQQNRLKHYSSYMDSMKYSAKLYMNSYEEDLFGDAKSGCAILSYEEMEKRNLLQNVKVDGATCYSDKTFVKVLKINDKYLYGMSIECRKVGSAEPEFYHYLDAPTCPEGSMVTLKAIPDHAKPYVKQAKIIVQLSSPTGIAEGKEDMEYAFSSEASGSNIIGNWKKLIFNVPKEDTQVDMVEDKGSVTIDSSQFSTPEGYTGDVYLVVKINHIEDLAETDWTSLEESKKVFGPYALDNTRPTGEIQVVTVSTPSDKRTMNVVVNDNLRLKEYSLTKEKETVSYTNISGNKTNYTVSKEITGDSVGKYSLKVRDLAGNESDVITKSFYRTEYDANGGKIGSSNDTTRKIVTAEGESILLEGGTRVGYTIKGWYTAASGGELVGKVGDSYKPTKTSKIYAQWSPNQYTVKLDQQNATTNGTTQVTAKYETAMPSITKPTRAYKVEYNANGGSVSPSSATAAYTFGGYYTETGGKGIQYYTAAPASAKKWDKTEGAILYAKWTSTSVKLPMPTWSGNIFKGWYTSCSGGTKIGLDGDNYTPTADIKLCAHWEANTFTLTYDNQGGSGCSYVTKNYNEAWGTLCTPSRGSNYTFMGWNTAKDGTGTTITASHRATSNLKVYAQWRTAGGIYSLGCTNYRQDCSMFQNDSWATIVSTVKSEAGSNRTSYPVGCTKSVYLSGFGYRTLRVVNNSNYNCSKSSKTACGFVLEFTDNVTTRPYNSSATNAGGWPGSEIRSYINNTIYNSLPSELRNGIISTDVKSGGTNGVDSSTDKLYLLSISEIYKSGWPLNNASSLDSLTSGTRQLDYYLCENVDGASSLTGNRDSDDNEICFKKGASNKHTMERCSMQPLCSPCTNLGILKKSDTYYWLRSANGRNNTQFWAVNNGRGLNPEGNEVDCACYAGTAGTRGASKTFGISPAFRLA